ncbi:hypothetical protein JZ751_004829 [Albula glossodonta]|uniref:Centrosomal protein 128 n=1 Tax=Albula glossodonta TaxID=121402 RepID=A0A8T2PCA3_9TELE|nr:hypothetical protein JZ751_004829 [Albula glossodonta]
MGTMTINRSMAQSSSESENYSRSCSYRSRARDAQSRNRRWRSSADADISEKIDTLANTLQDTSQNLHNVDRLLGKYREHTDDQAEAMATLRSQRLQRTSTGRSASVSTLHTSDLEPGSASDGHRYCPTSPLRDYTGRRRSRSATVHSLHQSLRDLRSDQVRLGHDMDQEILRRNRAEVETKQTLERLSDNLLSSQRAESALRRREAASGESEEAMKSRLLRSECEKNKVEQELERTRRQLDKSEGGRDTLVQQVEELRTQLLRTEKERMDLQQQISLLASHKISPHSHEEQGRDRGSGERVELQREVQELPEAERAQSDRRREEVKSRAQAALRQWKAKCRSLERSLEEQSKEAQQSADKRREACKERDAHQVALQALGQQAEALRKELSDVLGRLAQREEEVRRQEVELSEARALRLGLEQEAREVRDASRALQEAAERQSLLEAQLREENRVMETRAEELERERQRDRALLLELRGEVRNLSTARAELASRLSQEEEARREAQRRLEEVAEEARVQGQQLRLERELHQSELDSLRGVLQDGRARQDRDLQETVKLCQLERDELQARLTQLQAEAAADKDKVRAHRQQVERMKTECDKLTEELCRTDEGYSQLHRKYQLLKQELEEKNRISELLAQIRRLEAEQESILSGIGAEIDMACQALSGDSAEKFKAISLSLGLQNDPHRWLAETKSKLQWLCEEVKEREVRARRLRRHVQQGREEIKGLKKSKETDQQVLLERISQQERLLEDIHEEKRDLLEKTRKKDEDLRSLQDRISDLELSTRLALDHLESVPEKLSLLENFKDLEESQRQREMVEQRYTRYKEIVDGLQHQLEESKRRIQDYRDEKMDAVSRSMRLAALSSSIHDQSSFLSSSLLNDRASPHKRFSSPDFDSSLLDSGSSPVNGAKFQTQQSET